MDKLGVVLALALPVVASGCFHTQVGVDPVVTGSSFEQGVLDDLLGQEGQITAIVENRGTRGNVEVTARIFDVNGTTLSSASETVNMEANETREVRISIDVPQGADSFNVTAE